MNKHEAVKKFLDGEVFNEVTEAPDGYKCGYAVEEGKLFFYRSKTRFQLFKADIDKISKEIQAIEEIAEKACLATKLENAGLPVASALYDTVRKQLKVKLSKRATTREWQRIQEKAHALGFDQVVCA